MRQCVLVWFAALLALARAASGEEAVVLSGGGSRGLAHAGALVGLERRGHDPDLVVGTSMGAIIGALYACGYEPESIWRIVAREDWRGVFEPMPTGIGPRRDLRHPVLHLENGPRGVLIAKGYIADWRINRELVRTLFSASARARGDFDRLPRRFRAIAADVDSGRMIPLASGDLARAARASMAVSGFFSPIRWGDHLLFDGGIGDYLPVAEARRLGADFVIAVDVLRPPPRPTSLDALAVARRSIDLLLLKVRSGDPDVLVLPKIDPGLSPYTYPVDPTLLLQEGLEAALATVKPDSSLHAAREIQPPPERLGALVMDPPGSRLESLLRRGFGRIAPGPYDTSRVLQSLDRLYATGMFEGVWPSVESRGDSARPALVVRSENHGPTSLAGALGYDNDRGGRIWSTLRHLASIAGTPVVAALEGSADGIEQWGAVSASVPSLSRVLSAWTAGGFYGETELPPLGTDVRDPEVRRGGGWLGAEWRRFDPDLEASAGLNTEEIRSDVGPDGGSYGPWLRVGAFPPLAEEVGTRPELTAKLRFGQVDYWRVRVKGSLGRSFGPLSTAILGDFTGVSEDAPLDEVPSMGEEHLMPALKWGERRGRARAILGLDASCPAAWGGTLRLRLRAGALVDELNTDPVELGTRTRRLGGVGLSAFWWSVLGKIEAGFEAGTLGDRRVIVDLGPKF